MDTITLTIIQTQLFWENKTANLNMLQEKINNIAVKTNVVVLPEMFSTGFSMNAPELAEPMDGAVMKWMKKISAKKGIILTGSFIAKELDDTYYNRLIWMQPNGQYGMYNKRHLFAYAQENKYYSPGNKRLIASANGWRINLLVCYDLRFPVWARQSMHMDIEKVTSEYDILIYIANWPQSRSLAWKTLLQARAIENQCYVIGVNRVGYDGNNIYYDGDSMIVDPLGEILYHKTALEDVFTITFHKSKLEEIRNRFPFGKDRDAFKLY